jgi:hypothetical protein
MGLKRGRHIKILLTLLFFSATLFSAENKRLDGVEIQAVESFPYAKKFEVSLGVGLLPLDPYYSTLGISASITNNFDHFLAWEILNANYGFPIQKDLVASLAEQGVNPASIIRLDWIVSSSIGYFFNYGKSALFNQYIQKSRAGLFLGPAFVKVSSGFLWGGQLSARFENLLTEELSWRFEIKDTITIPGFVHYLYLGLLFTYYI